MNDLVLKAIVSGLAFGAWPIFMNHGGLSGSVASFVLALGVAICALPFAMLQLQTRSGNLYPGMVVLAVVSSAIGMLLFNNVITQVSAQDIGRYFVIMIVFQITLASIYDTAMNRTLGLRKVAGFVLAVIVALLLA